MADENAQAGIDTPIEGSSTATTGTEGAIQADVSTATLEDTIDGQKIDISKMTPDELKGYKRAQGHFTKFTQSYKDKETELSNKMKSYESVLSDEVVNALAYHKMNGRLPEGVDPVAFSQKVSEMLGQAPANSNPADQPYIDENTKNILVSLIQKELSPFINDAKAGKVFAEKETHKRAESTIADYAKELTGEDPELGKMFNEAVENGQLSDAIAKSPFNPDFKARLAFAFNGLTGSNYIPKLKERTRQMVMQELQNKNKVDRPIVAGGGGATKTAHSKDLKQILSDEIDKATSN